MPDPISLDAGFSTTTMVLTERFARTRPRLVALRDIAERFAHRRGTAIVPADICTEVQAVLVATQSIVARQRGARRPLGLGATADWATLLAKLELALTALALFREEYSEFDDEVGATVWRDETWLELHRHGSEYGSADNSLYES
jgi:hypothetical protein